MKNWKAGRPAAVMGITLVLLAGLAGCSSGSGGSEQPESTVLWTNDGGVSPALDAAVDRFNADSDSGDIDFESLVSTNYPERLRTAMNSSRRPGIFYNWGGGDIRDYVDAELLVPLDDAFAADPELRDAFLPSMLDVANLDGKFYGIPVTGSQPVVLFYNKSVLEEAGIEPPQTMDDVFDAIPILQENGVIPFSQPGGDSWTLMMWWQYLVDRIGGPEVFNKITAGEWDEGWSDPAVLEATQTIADLVDAGAFGDNFASIAYGQGGSETLLAEGQAALYLMGSWAYGSFLQNNPDFAASDLGYINFPAVTGGAGNPANLAGNPTTFLSISTAANEQTAVDFLPQLYSDDYVKEIIAIGEVPVTTNAADLLAESPNPEFAEWQFELVANAEHFQQSWDRALGGDLATPMMTEMQRLFLGQITPEQFVDQMLAIN